MIDESQMQPGLRYIIDGKVWTLCPDCRQIVRVDKPLFGGLHLCWGGE